MHDHISQLSTDQQVREQMRELFPTRFCSDGDHAKFFLTFPQCFAVPTTCRNPAAAKISMN
jgi:hypothetical protein